jgi:hypothetical protein
MGRIREWSFPVALLTLWVLAAGYTFSSLGQAHAAVSAADKPAAVVRATVEMTVIGKKHMSLTQKPPARRGPRA